LNINKNDTNDDKWNNNKDDTNDDKWNSSKNGQPKDDISFGLENTSRLPIIMDGEDEETEDDRIDEDEDETKVTFQDDEWTLARTTRYVCQP